MHMRVLKKKTWSDTDPEQGLIYIFNALENVLSSLEDKSPFNSTGVFIESHLQPICLKPSFYCKLSLVILRRVIIVAHADTAMPEEKRAVI